MSDGFSFLLQVLVGTWIGVGLMVCAVCGTYIGRGPKA